MEGEIAYAETGIMSEGHIKNLVGAGMFVELE